MLICFRDGPPGKAGTDRVRVQSEGYGRMRGKRRQSPSRGLQTSRSPVSLTEYLQPYKAFPIEHFVEKEYDT